VVVAEPPDAGYDGSLPLQKALEALGAGDGGHGKETLSGGGFRGFRLGRCFPGRDAAQGNQAPKHGPHPRPGRGGGEGAQQAIRLRRHGIVRAFGGHEEAVGPGQGGRGLPEGSGGKEPPVSQRPAPVDENEVPVPGQGPVLEPVVHEDHVHAGSHGEQTRAFPGPVGADDDGNRGEGPAEQEGLVTGLPDIRGCSVLPLPSPKHPA
jgi:hypothetical protein